MPGKPLAELTVPSASPEAGGLLGSRGSHGPTAATGARGGRQAPRKAGSAGQAPEVTYFTDGASTASALRGSRRPPRLQQKVPTGPGRLDGRELVPLAAAECLLLGSVTHRRHCTSVTHGTLRPPAQVRGASLPGALLLAAHWDRRL